MPIETKKTGTKEWAPHSMNIFTGCSHNCRYCYARHDALRYKRIADPEKWTTMEPNHKAYLKKAKKIDGRIMFPTTHDLLPEHKWYIRDYLEPWLEEGNDFLLVTKPHLEVVKFLCEEFVAYRKQITWRFTIGSMDDEILRFWEPGAPSFIYRLSALQTAYSRGYSTSVSCEPFLDRKVKELFLTLRSAITDTFWVGKMNRISTRVDVSKIENKDFFRYVEPLINPIKEGIYSDHFIKNELYGDLAFRYDEKVRWKDSIKKVLGLPEEDIG
jgi:DNA repair photolyase